MTAKTRNPNPADDPDATRIDQEAPEPVTAPEIPVDTVSPVLGDPSASLPEDDALSAHAATRAEAEYLDQKAEREAREDAELQALLDAQAPVLEVTSSPPPAFTNAGGTGERVYARRGNGAWGYGPISAVDRGQVFELRNMPRDAFLLETGYVERLPAGATVYECPECGVPFIDLGARQGHVRRRHSGEAILDPMEAEQRELEATNRDERVIAATAPLYLPSAERPSATA